MMARRLVVASLALVLVAQASLIKQPQNGFVPAEKKGPLQLDPEDWPRAGRAKMGKEGRLMSHDSAPDGRWSPKAEALAAVEQPKDWPPIQVGGE